MASLSVQRERKQRQNRPPPSVLAPVAGPHSTAGASGVRAQHTQLTVSAASSSPLTSSYTQPTTQPHAQSDVRTCHFGGGAGGVSVPALGSGRRLLFFQPPQPHSPPAQAQQPCNPLGTSALSTGPAALCHVSVLSGPPLLLTSMLHGWRDFTAILDSFHFLFPHLSGNSNHIYG